MARINWSAPTAVAAEPRRARLKSAAAVPTDRSTNAKTTTATTIAAAGNSIHITDHATPPTYAADLVPWLSPRPRRVREGE